MRLNLRRCMTCLALLAVFLALAVGAWRNAASVEVDSGDSTVDEIAYVMAVLPRGLPSAVFLVMAAACFYTGISRRDLAGD